MTEEELRRTVARNIAACRKQQGLTQSELAERLHYSDKSISKWERAEGLPDVFVLTQIAELFGVGVGELLSETPPPARRGPRRVLISVLSVGLAFLVGSVVFFALQVFAPALPRTWLAFCYALAVSCIILVVFTTLWWSLRERCLAVSALIWSLALCVQLTANVPRIGFIWVVAAILQVLAVLWFIYMGWDHRRKNK